MKVVKKRPAKTVKATPKLMAKPKLPKMAMVKETAKLVSLYKTDIVPADDKYIPKYQTDGSCCCDLVANIPTDEMGRTYIVVPYRNIIEIDCGFSMAVPKGFKAEIMVRSSFGKKGLIVVNGPGQIDEDYRGAVKALVSNVGHEIVQINDGDRFAQMSLTPVYKFEFNKVAKLAETKRGAGGFGSTGKK